MDDPVKNNKTTGKRRGTPASAQPLEIGATTTVAGGGQASAPPHEAANQAHHEAAPQPAASAGGKETENADAASAARPRKAKLVRAGFALTKDDHAALAGLKAACLQDGAPVKKSQLLRVAIGLLRQVDTAAIGQMVAALPPTKKGRKGK
jgi:hypothetical protein